MGLLPDHHIQVVVIAIQTAENIPFEERARHLEEMTRHLEKICLGQRDPLSTDGKNLRRIWRNLLNILADDKIMTKTATRHHDVPSLLEEAARYLKKVCLEQCDLSTNKKNLERIRRNLEGIFMGDDGDNKVTTALLFYNGPDLNEIYSLRESARYPRCLRRIRIGWLSPRSTYEYRLERIRQDLMKILKDNEAATCLLFYNGPDLTEIHSLVLNAAQSPDSIVAPRIKVPVPQQVPAQQEEGEE